MSHSLMAFFAPEKEAVLPNAGVNLSRRSTSIRLTSFSSYFAQYLLLGSIFTFLSGCDGERQAHDAAERDPITGLTPTESKEVLVKVGPRSITLGDYAATLLRMDRFERLRFQSEERQKQLLDEMIEVELLAQEAKRLGLDKDLEVQLQIQQAMRDELLRRVEAKIKPASAISERAIRDYYKAHRSEFKEPERRRVLAIQLGNKARALSVLEEAQGASGEEWGKLAQKYSLNRYNLGEADAHELAGDLGFVSASGEKRGQNENVPDPVRAAIFEVKKVGDVASRPIQDGEFYYVVRMGGLSSARDRSITDADRTIRVELRRRMFLEAEKKLEADLRKKYPVVIDEKAILNYQPKTREHPLPSDNSVRPARLDSIEQGEPSEDDGKVVAPDPQLESNLKKPANK